MSNTVTVGCKLPNGLILELGKRGDSNHRSVRINGTNSAVLVGGHGMTEGVDAGFMEAWLKKHQWLPAVRDGHVFVQTDAASATAQAIERSKEKTGLERLDPKDAPAGITPDPEHMKQSMAEAPRLAVGR